MVFVPRCPQENYPQGEVPDQLGCTIEVGAACPIPGFNLFRSSGLIWTGQIVGGSQSITVELNATETQTWLTANFNIQGCEHSPFDEATVACSPYYAETRATSDPGCCPDPQTESEGILITVDTTPRPNEPPVAQLVPTCPPTKPEECCDDPGGFAGTGGSWGAGGGGRPMWHTGGIMTDVAAGGGGGLRGGVMGGIFGGGGGPFSGGPKQKCCDESGLGGAGTGGARPSCRGGFRTERGSCRPPMFSTAPVRYATGEIALTAVDLESGGFGNGWGHTRSFASRLRTSESVGNGYNWQVEQWPYAIHDLYGNVGILGQRHSALWFTKNGNSFTGEFSIKQTLMRDGENELYRLYQLDGSIIEFDIDSGLFRKHTDPGGNTIEVTAMHGNGYNFTEVERSYTSGGSTTTEQYYYEYKNFGNDYYLERITLRRKVDEGAWSNVTRASYTYYTDSDVHGAKGDIATVTTEIWDDNQWKDTGTTLYRYYVASTSSSSSSSSSSSGGEYTMPLHLLKYVVQPQAYQQLKDDPDVTDPLTASDFKVAQYADYYFEYDADRRVTKERILGGALTYTFSYSESGNDDGYNSWKYKTVETLPSGDENIVYSNYAGQTMLFVFKSDTDEWCEFWKYNDDARVVLHANPSAISGYGEQYADLLHDQSGNYEYLKDSDGLIHTFEYDSASGYVTAEKIKNGETGSEIKLREYEYLACPSLFGTSSSSSSSSSSSGAAEPAAYFTSKEIVYPDDTDQNKKITTSYAYTFHDGTCQVQQKTTTLPAVSTSQNGSGTAATNKEVFDQYGNLEWAMDERGFITRMKYDTVTGGLTELIQDVDTSQVSDEPTGWETPTGGGLHIVTAFEHDDLGRMTQSLGPAHTVDLDGTATSVRRASWTVYKDVDQQVWTGLGYATGASWDTFTLINPVNIVEFDRNGQPLEEIQAQRSSTSGKLSGIDSFTQSSYLRWTTHQYTDCCFLEWTRVYHTIPASGAGSEGTNYDQTNFGYDSTKRQNRHVTGGGTITRTVFDARSNPTKIYVGTDDTGATANDPTGGGAQGNNMVLVTEYEYDSGNDGGDNLLTKETQYVD